ncbi:hypothetical protein ABTC87_18395, partial [Acinetobacter baumannii]
LWMAVILLMYCPFNTIPKYVSIVALVCFAGYLFILFRKNSKLPKLLPAACFTVIGVNIFLNTAFYPSLLKYQKGSAFATYIEKNQLDKNNIVLL